MINTSHDHFFLKNIPWMTVRVIATWLFLFYKSVQQTSHLYKLISFRHLLIKWLFTMLNLKYILSGSTLSSISGYKYVCSNLGGVLSGLRVDPPNGRDGQYLAQAVGQVLAEALAEVCVKKPPDPIEYLSHLLRQQADKTRLAQEVGVNFLTVKLGQV